MRRWVASLCILSILFISLMGCMAKTHLVPVYSEMTPDYTKMKVIKHFKVEEEWGYWYAIFGLIPVKEPDAQKIVQGQLKTCPGCKITNMTIHTESSPLNILASIGVSVITFGFGGLIWTPQKMVVEGDIVK